MSESKRNKAKTRDRLVQAAIEVFSTAGVLGATTREIARVAGVSEVTLFRHFQSKEQLLAAVVEQITALQAEALAAQAEWTQDLPRDLRHYAELYSAMLEENEALVRMFIGEAKRYPDAATQVLQQSTRPLRDRLVQYLHNGIDRGSVSPDVDLSIAVDLFTGMLLAGVLRRHLSEARGDYSRDRYLAGCVDLFVRGIAFPAIRFLDQIPL